MTRVVLASASSGRRMVLRQAGIDPVILVSGVDEDAVIAALGAEAAPADVANALAAAKAEQVVANLEPAPASDCVVIGCDSMLLIDGRLCGKPESVDGARRQWESMRGRAGHLHTGHCVIRVRDGVVVNREVECDSTTVHFGTPTDDELAAYLATGESLQVAGAFTIDGLGGWFIDGIEGDPSNVIGLSLPTMRRLLHRVGLSIAGLWADNPL
ncbi:nucleoside triphosphate pyrophosphatase [Mycolicibacterium sp. 120270]|uniref:Maf family protein n=1 Tax=Mycolicibacterium sp. 120270 TaxID=3090600 RepID=UPI00299DB867|nr:nucleoside triphosphate pyrophosphatase [Mycolicibacterium sp. 120270]MDX1884101.1 nucleoside triphosphate pyrophosphatase [Mycolicibacterium sp. 120270]